MRAAETRIGETEQQAQEAIGRARADAEAQVRVTDDACDHALTQAARVGQHAAAADARAETTRTREDATRELEQLRAELAQVRADAAREREQLRGDWRSSSPAAIVSTPPNSSGSSLWPTPA